jgi:membrane fusion protein (multidrug efflux system)
MLDEKHPDSEFAGERDWMGGDLHDAAPAKAPPADRQEKPSTEAPSKPQDKPETQEKPQNKPDDEHKPEGEDKPEAEEKKPAFWRRRPLTTVSVIVLVAVAGAAGYVYYDYAAHFESTDDAFVAARQISIAPRVTGNVVSVPVTDNQHVNAGEVIAQLDPRDYQTALDQAKAQVDVAKASIANIHAQQDVQAAQIAAAKAQVAQAKATRAFAQQQAARYQTLAQKGAGTVENAQQYTSQLGQQDASVASAEANETVAERQLETLKAQLESAQATLSVDEAQVETAKLNLSYTTVRADIPGRVVQLSAEKGELAQPGTALTMFVPDEIWIVANFKETQLDRMRPGQPVEYTIDAYPDKTWKAHVDSVQPGSGTAFSLLPAQNATGNYVKIVQRVPVKLSFDTKPDDVALGPGMSIEPDVRVDPTPSLWERMTDWYGGWRGRL